jgi:hypothetical protein
MTKKSKPPPKRETRMMRELGGGQNTYLGEKAVTPVKKKAEVVTTDGIKRLDPKELKFLKGYFETGTYSGAYRTIRPDVKDGTAWKMGSVMWKRIREKLSLEEIHEALGVSLGNIDRTLAEGMSAKFQRQFITRDGKVISAGEQVDHPTRIAAAKEAARLLGLTEDKGEVPMVTVTIFCKPEEVNTWPGSKGDLGADVDFDTVDVTPKENE